MSNGRWQCHLQIHTLRNSFLSWHISAVSQFSQDMTPTNEIPMEHMSGSDGIPGTNVHQSQYQTMWKTLSIVLLLLSVFFMVELRCDAPSYYGQLKMIHGIVCDTVDNSSRFLFVDLCSICRLAAMKGVEMSASMIFEEPKEIIFTYFLLFDHSIHALDTNLNELKYNFIHQMIRMDDLI